MSEYIERKPSLIKYEWIDWGKPSLIKNDRMYREKLFSNRSFSTTPTVIGREFLTRILPCQYYTATRTFRFFRFGHNLGIFVLLDLFFYPRSKWLKPNPKQNCPLLPWLCPKQKIRNDLGVVRCGHGRICVRNSLPITVVFMWNDW